MGTYTERARALRPFIIKAAASLSDADALQAKELYARWAAGMVVEPGDRLVHAVDGVDKLFRVNEGKGHTTQKGWEPDKTPALFTVINETNAGTKEDPIPASRGMEYTYGLYYTDPEDTKLYLCERTGSTAGDKITLQYLPHELVGQYFSSVE
jgi:hypothetical protein